MIKSYQYLDIDINKKTYRRLRAVQGDSKSRYILVSLYDNSKAYNLSNCSVKVFGCKSDKKIFFNYAIVTDAINGKFEIELTNQALAVAGELEIQILMLGTNQERLTSFSFYIDVEKSIVNDGVIESANEFKALTGALSQVEEWNGYFEETSGKIEEKYTERLNNVDSQLEQIVDHITYEQFGATGDGKVDDYLAIFKAHEFANANNKKIITNRNKTYLIKDVNNPIIIKNSVDWANSKFIIDDRNITSSNCNKSIFIIKSDNDEVEVNLSAISKKTKFINSLSNYKGLLYIENNQVKQFIRKGVNSNTGEYQQEVIFIDNGRVLTDILWDYDNISYACIREYDNSQITIEGGAFYTLANTLQTEWNGVARNILCNRDNVIIKGLQHYIEFDNDSYISKPYQGFIKIDRCINVNLDNLQLDAHKVYYNEDIPYGNYAFSIFHSINVNINNIKQTNDILNTSLWGICETSYNKNLKFNNCYMNRIDSHKGCLNIEITNCTTRIINLIGYGKAYIKNTVNYGDAFVNLREDFGCSWNGDLIIEDCEFSPPNSISSDVVLIHGRNDGSHDFGYKCYFPNVILKNVKINNHNSTDDFSFIYNKTTGSTPISTSSELSYEEENAKGLYPYIFKNKFIIENVTFLNPCNAHIFYDMPHHCYGENKNKVVEHDTSTNVATPFCSITPNYYVELIETNLNSRYNLFKNTNNGGYSYNNYRLVPFIKIKKCDISLHLQNNPIVVRVEDSNVQEVYIGQTSYSGTCYISNSSLGYCDKYTINKIVNCSNRSIYLDNCLLTLSGKESQSLTSDIIKTSYSIFNYIGQHNDKYRMYVKMNNCKYTFDTKLIVTDDDFLLYDIDENRLNKHVNFNLFNRKQ